MSWSWSHTDEAYANARTNVESLPRESLEVIFAEWCAVSPTLDYDDDFDNEVYEQSLALAKTLPDDALADDIWCRMSEQAICDNGGWNAWACPYGCHTVPFDLLAAAE